MLKHKLFKDKARILKHFCVSLFYFKMLYLKLYEFLKVFLAVLEVERQDFYTIKWRNTLENPNNHLYVFLKQS